jgi:hypothetical protein
MCSESPSFGANDSAFDLVVDKSYPKAPESDLGQYC